MRILIIVLISAVLVIGLFWTKPETYADLQSSSLSIVEVETVKQIDIQPTIKVTGKLEPARKARLHFQVSGQINKRFVEAGQKVEVNMKILILSFGLISSNSAPRNPCLLLFTLFIFESFNTFCITSNVTCLGF